MKIFCIYVLILIALCTLPCSSSGIYPQYAPADDSVKIIEKVYLHTDRESYYPGDDLWFKAYLVDASDLILTSQSNNLHVELISPSSEIIKSLIVRLDEGLGNGDFKLGEKLQSGRYRLRAYTNYMRNTGDQLFFNKNIVIINPADALKTFPDSISSLRDKHEISFFPEGGSLVDSVPCIVAFKAVNSNGEGTDVTGEVYSSTGNIVTTFRSSHRGIGAFTINPVPGVRYYSITKDPEGNSVKMEMPKSFVTGIVLNVKRDSDKKYIVSFKTNIRTLSILSDQDLLLTVSARNEVYKTFNIQIRSLNSFFVLPVDDLPDGIFMLTLTGREHELLCERLIYIQNTGDIMLNLETNKKLYNQRDSISVKIALTKNSDICDDVFLSFSAAKNISINSSLQFPSTISSWFLLESDVKGTVEEPSYYFDPSNPNRLKDLDLLLLTQGWRDFKWKHEKMNYHPEDGFTIAGRIRKLFADEPLKNSKVNIAIFKSGNPLIRTVSVDSSGRFRLDSVDFNGKAKVIISSTGEKEQPKGWVLLDSITYSPEPVLIDSESLKFPVTDKRIININQQFADDQVQMDNVKKYIQYAEINKSIQKKYKLSDTINPGTVTITAKRQDKPESARARSRHYLMATPDMELVITSKLQVYRDVYQLIRTRFFAPVPMISSPRIQNPLFMINGVKVSWENIVGFPVSFVERIDVINNPAAVGMFGAMGGVDPTHPIDGVISIITREGAPTIAPERRYSTINIGATGYNEPRIFYSPKHHTTLQSDFKPDLRTTLYWEPNINMETGKDFFVNYFNADNPSKVTVTVEGITSTGIPVTGKTEYEVK